MKIRIKYLHVMLFSVYNFHENRCKEGRAFLTGVNKVALMRVS